jgi:hypothetical protein
VDLKIRERFARFGFLDIRSAFLKKIEWAFSLSTVSFCLENDLSLSLRDERFFVEKFSKRLEPNL